LRRWEYNAPSPEAVRRLREELAVGATLAGLLVRLGLGESVETRRFLRPRLADIACPFGIPNLERAARRLSQAIDGQQRIVICGDYDVDGVTSTALLVAVLRELGNFPHFIVPLRLEEGYGLTQKAVERALEGAQSPDLFVAIDCGTNSVEEAQRIIDSHCDLIVVDHHQSKRPLPEEAILVNPHAAAASASEFAALCSVGLVFKLAYGLIKLRRAANDPAAFAIKLRRYLDLVAMGTVADLAPLRRENRVFARIGLEELARTERVGLKSLMKVSGIDARNGVGPIDISFRLAPRINASGRLADAAVAVELMLSDDRAFSMETSLQLDSFNRERQEIERAITDEAMGQIEDGQKGRDGLVVYGRQWHPGVVGIVASRVSRALDRPCIALGREGPLAKGSGRSVDGVNLVKALSPFGDRLESWGGHPMAVGVALLEERVEDFRGFFDQAVKKLLVARESAASLEIFAWLTLEEANETLLADLDLLAPFGQENPEPVFATKGVVLRQSPVVFKDAHFRFLLRDGNGRAIPGVAWNQAERLPPLGRPIDIAYRLCWNCYGRRKTLQMELIDWQ